MLSRIRGLKIIYPNAFYHDDIGLQLWSCSSSELTNCSWLDLAQCVLRIVELCPSHQAQPGLKCLWEEEICFSLGLSLADFDTLSCTEGLIAAEEFCTHPSENAKEAILLHLGFLRANPH